MDYQAELKRLQEGGNYWKPEKKNAQFKVKALSELEEAEPYKEKPQAKLKILVNGIEKTWTFGVGETPASTYGQLVNLASNRSNSLIGAEFTVIVKSDGTKNDYTIVI